MQFCRVINGIAVCATYSDEEVNGIFIPLLKKLADIRAQKKKRILVMLAAPPGAGKSTLAGFLEHISPDVIPDHKVQAAGLEGNYLLLDEDGWSGLSDMADYTISVTADPEMLKERLLARKIASGATAEEAEKFVSFSDMANVRLCLERTKPADLQLQVSKESGFTVVYKGNG